MKILISICLILCFASNVTAKQYKFKLTGSITSISHQEQTHESLPGGPPPLWNEPYFLVGDEVEFEFVLDDSAICDEFGNGFTDAIEDFKFNLSNNSLGTYTGGSSTSEDLYIWQDADSSTNPPSPFTRFFVEAVKNLNFPDLDGDYYPWLFGFDNIAFDLLDSPNINAGDSLADVLNGIDIKEDVYLVQGIDNYGIGTATFNLFFTATPPTETTVNSDRSVYGILDSIEITEYNTLTLNTYKSYDMQNWELIESKEIQSEDALFLKSEIVTQ